jgi:hypothetical protein
MITILPIDDEERAQYQRFYKEHTPVGWMEEESITRLIVKMKRGYKGWTPSGCARDCGDHYIVAHYGSYTRVDKRTLTVTKDVEDK